jgi:hypothetical protein
MTLPVITAAEATAYFATTPRTAEWTALTDQDIQLAEAQRWLGNLCFDQDAECCGRLFADGWLQAVSELALALSKNPTAIMGGGTSGATIKKAQLGGLSVEYFEAGAGDQKVSSSGPAVLQAFPWLVDMLRCWLRTPTGSGRVLHRTCTQSYAYRSWI